MKLFFEDICHLVHRLEERRRLLTLVAPAKAALSALDSVCGPADFAVVRANLAETLARIERPCDDCEMCGARAGYQHKPGCGEGTAGT